MSTSFKTRIKTEIWLIRETIDEISLNELPSYGDILVRIVYHVSCFLSFQWISSGWEFFG